MEAMLHYRPVSAFAGRTAQFAIDRFFGGPLDDAALAIKPPSEVTGFASANLYETPEGYRLEVPMPGVKAEDVEITVQDNRLTVKAQRRWELPPNAKSIWRAFGSGELQQTVTLPGEVHSGAVQADLHDGVLRLELPKAESARPRTITVNGLNGAAHSASRAMDRPTEGVVEKAIG
jgi:HSP20 family protein